MGIWGVNRRPARGKAHFMSADHLDSPDHASCMRLPSPCNSTGRAATALHAPAMYVPPWGGPMM